MIEHAEYADSIVHAIESSKVLVLLYSKNADESDQVRREVERAVSTGIHIMPVRIEDTEMSPSFEYYVGSIHWLDAIALPFEEHIDKLAQGLMALLAMPEDKSEPPVPDSSRIRKPAPPPLPAPDRDGEGPGTPPKPRRSRALAALAVMLVVIGGAAGAFYVRPVVVQRVDGVSVTDARARLEGQGFEVDVQLEASEAHDGGTAIRTEPAAGETTGRRSKVTVFVSGMVILPQLAGLSEQNAIDRLETLSAGTVPFSRDAITIEYEFHGEQGTVLSTSPGAGAEVLLTDPVTLYVSGPTVKVPPAVDMTEADAVAAMNSAQLRAVIVRSWEDGARPGSVLKTEPEAQAEVDRDTEVRLFVVGRGGWIYIENNRRKVGDVFNLSTARTLRDGPSGMSLGALDKGTTVRVLEKQVGGDWVKAVAER